MEEKMGELQFFFCRTWGALKGQKDGWGGGSDKSKNFYLPYFGMMFEGGTRKTWVVSGWGLEICIKNMFSSNTLPATEIMTGQIYKHDNDRAREITMKQQ